MVMKISCVCVLSRFSHVWLFAAHQAPLSTGFSRQEHWSGLPFPSPGALPNPGTEPESLTSPALQADSLPLSHLEAQTHNISVHQERKENSFGKYWQGSKRLEPPWVLESQRSSFQRAFSGLKRNENNYSNLILDFYICALTLAIKLKDLQHRVCARNASTVFSLLLRKSITLPVLL